MAVLPWHPCCLHTVGWSSCLSHLKAPIAYTKVLYARYRACNVVEPSGKPDRILLSLLVEPKPCLVFVHRRCPIITQY